MVADNAATAARLADRRSCRWRLLREIVLLWRTFRSDLKFQISNLRCGVLLKHLVPFRGSLRLPIRYRARFVSQNCLNDTART